MNWRSHVIVGVLSVVVLILVLWWFRGNPGWIIMAWCVPIAVVSSLVPDLDHPNGKLRNLLIGLSFLIIIIGFLYAKYVGVVGYSVMAGAAIVGIGAFIFSKVFKHRGFVHSILFCAIFGVIVYLSLQSVLFAAVAFVGSWSHLLADGIPFKLR